VCGISGIVNYGSGAPVDVGTLQAMVAAMTHRGPDEDGFHLDREAGLGMRRLSIIDVLGGSQPIANEARSMWVVSNGEIYNFRELRSELEAHGHVFATRSDTEVIVHAYEQWGSSAFSRLNGMFGTALWDSKERVLVLARDPFGIKPLYYWDDGVQLAFASEVRALFCHPDIRRAVDTRAIADFLSLTYVPAPRTAFEGVSKLLPGHLLVCTRRGTRMERFYSSIPEPLEESEDELVERLRVELAAAVERQMVADVPIGVLLSGGTDSTTVATIMTESSQAPVQSFTVGFAGDFSMNELEPARKTAERLGLAHHEIVLSSGDFSGSLPEAVWHLEEPIATTSALAFYKICELARRHVKVVLTGQGADEPFAGYPRYLGERYGGLYRRVPSGVRALIAAPLVRSLPRNERLKRAVASLGTDDEVERMTRVYTVLDDDLRDELLTVDRGHSAELRDAIHRWHSDAANLDPLGKMLYVDARLSLPDNLLLYADKMSMAVSLEARVPFLDLELMALAESIPTAYKIRGLRQKVILKRAMSRWLPDDVLQRKKVGFATPVDEWFRGEMQPLLQERLLDDASACRMYLRADVVERIIRDHQSGRHDHKRILFGLLTLEVWHELFVRPPVWPTTAADAMSMSATPA
jgi:asparagine synthase (glutamine-hydrolysing)